MFFNESIRSKKTSEKTEKNKLKYLHYLNKMTEKCNVRKFIISEFSCFYPATLLKDELFHRIVSKF